MLTRENKELAIQYITKYLGQLNIGHRATELGEVINKLKDKDFPPQVAADLVYLKIDLINESDYIIYSILEAIDTPRHMITKYGFDKSDCESYSQKYETEIFDFPLKYNMVEVNKDEMWIGAISARDLMKLKDAQLIYYNENTQRRLKHITDSRGGVEYYTIDIKQSSIESIQKLMLNNTYVPDAIVLNMPEDTEFSYSAKTQQLIIKNIDHFDIIDGYHRYRAISNLCTKYKDFDYMMQLQIVNFSESKAQHFIWQKDQQTKLRKLDSDSLNQENAGTKVAKRLNFDSTCNMASRISRNNELIDEVQLSNAIQCIFFNGQNGLRQDMRDVIQATKDIKDTMNSITEMNPDLLTKKWTFLDIIKCVVEARCYDANMRESINLLLNEKGEYKYLSEQGYMRKIDATRIAKDLGVKI